MVAHGHFQVNGRKVSVPSFLVRWATQVQLRGDLEDAGACRPTTVARAGGTCPSGSSWRPAEKSGTVRSLPLRDDIQIPVQEQLIVELYSK